MDARSNASPVIIKRKKVVTADGHHGGAWKVAYADFVTAMMAFFMLMWLLNATTEKQRKGIADYFNPNVPINRISGGGDANFGGDSVFTEQTLARNGSGGLPPMTLKKGHLSQGEAQKRDAEKFSEIEKILIGKGGESLVSKNLLKHVVTRQTDRGLIIELHDLPGIPLFVEGQAAPYSVLLDLVRVVVELARTVENGVAVEGHVKSVPAAVADPGVWRLSGDRANAVRILLQSFELPPDRMKRVTGHADRKLIHQDPMSSRNNRIEIILLRSDL